MPKRLQKPKILPDFLKVLVMLCPVFVVSAFLFAFSPIVQAYSSCALNGINCNTALHCDNNGVYVTSFTNNTLEIDYITNTAIKKCTLNVEGDVKSVATDNGIIYAISATNDTLYLNRYIYNKNTLNSFVIESTPINSNYQFAVIGDLLYFTDNENYNQIACHSIYGEKIYSFSVNAVTGYCTDNNGTLYICDANQIYTVDTTYNSQPQPTFSHITTGENIYFCNNAIFDQNGNIINLQNGLTITTSITSNKLNAAVINGYYCKYSSGSIYGYTEKGTPVPLYSINAGENAQLCSFNDNLYILSDKKEIFIVNKSELNFPPKTTQPPTYSNLPSNPSTSTLTNNSGFNTPQSHSFSINNYYIDSSSNVIWNIPNNTTISTFKNNLTYSGYTLSFYDSNMVTRTKGQVGTGFTMVVKNDTTEHSKYTLSVKGDLSGDGKINRTDVTLLSEHLMSSTTLTTEQYVASDTNGDNIINGVDILKIAKNNL